jgi:dTDP-4-dehydrorhamnose 3,5-epimerase
MKIVDTKFKGLKIIKHYRNVDKRGNLRETFNKKFMGWENFVFEYATLSKKNILRGFHFQHKNPQAKLVTVIKGKIFDCVIDLRKKSKTFGKSFSIILSEKNCTSLFIPKGFAHAYYSYEKLNIIYYKCSYYYKPGSEDGIIWSDKTMKIRWPSKNPIVSKKDKNHETLNFFKNKYKGL